MISHWIGFFDFKCLSWMSQGYKNIFTNVSQKYQSDILENINNAITKSSKQNIPILFFCFEALFFWFLSNLPKKRRGQGHDCFLWLFFEFDKFFHFFVTFIHKYIYKMTKFHVKKIYVVILSILKGMYNLEVHFLSKLKNFYVQFTRFLTL